MPATLRVPFGILEGVLVEPHSVTNGKACGCVCPGCGRSLIAYNQGVVRTQHFGHWPGDECDRGIESAVHLAGKEALLREMRMSRPSLIVGTRGIVEEDCDSIARVRVEESTVALYTQVTVEETVAIDLSSVAPEFQPDLFATPSTTAPTRYLVRPDLRAANAAAVDWVEIRATHAVEQEKRRALQLAGLRVIEIDLSDFLRATVNLADIRKAVVDDLSRKTWISHPGVPAAMEAARMEATRENEKQRREEERHRIGREIASRPSRKWMGDGVPQDTPIVLPSSQVLTPDERYRTIEAKLRRGFGLSANERWPKHLHLDIVGNAGALVPARLWLPQLFLDWVHGRERGRFLLRDLVTSVSRKYGVESPRGSSEMHRLLARRVLPYWAACGYVVLLEGEAIELTGKAARDR